MERKRVWVIHTKPRQYFPIVSWIIRLLTWSKDSHTIWGFPDDGKFFHIHFNDMEFMTEEQMLKNHKIVRQHTIYMPEENYKASMARAEHHAQLGKQSGYFIHLICIFITLFARRLFGKNRRYDLPKPFFMGDAITFVCSSYVGQEIALSTRFYQNLDIPESVRAWAYHAQTMSVKDVWEVMEVLRLYYPSQNKINNDTITVYKDNVEQLYGKQ